MTSIGPQYDALGRRNLIGEALIEGDLPAALRLVIAIEDGNAKAVEAAVTSTQHGVLMSGVLTLLHSEGVQRHGSQEAFRNRLAVMLADIEGAAE